ncbi:hypothetical protein WJX77_002499 [Trebouxia sp. C0004]
MNEYASDHGTATERLIAFDSRYQGEAYLQAQRLEGLRLGHKDVGKNLEVQLNQFKKLCTIRGCPEFSKDEGIYMHNVITKASKDSAHAARSPPVDENRKQMDRSIISSDDLQELLRVCADTPDRLVATRAAALIKASLLTGEKVYCFQEAGVDKLLQIGIRFCTAAAILPQMSVQASDARAKVLQCTALDDKQKAKMLLLINTESDRTLPVFTGVPDPLLGLTLSAYLEGMTAGTTQTLADHSRAIMDTLFAPFDGATFPRQLSTPWPTGSPTELLYTPFWATVGYGLPEVIGRQLGLNVSESRDKEDASITIADKRRDYMQHLDNVLVVAQLLVPFKRPSPYPADEAGHQQSEVEITLRFKGVEKLFTVPGSHVQELLDVYGLLQHLQLPGAILCKSLQVNGPTTLLPSLADLRLFSCIEDLSVKLSWHGAGVKKTSSCALAGALWKRRTANLSHDTHTAGSSPGGVAAEGRVREWGTNMVHVKIRGDTTEPTPALQLESQTKVRDLSCDCSLALDESVLILLAWTSCLLGDNSEMTESPGSKASHHASSTTTAALPKWWFCLQLSLSNPPSIACTSRYAPRSARA